MRTFLIVLVLAGVVVGAIYGGPPLYMWYLRTRTGFECQDMAHALAVRLLREPTANVSDKRLEELMRQPGVLEYDRPTERSPTGLPLDRWGTRFFATIIHENGELWIEVRSAGPNASFDDDDDVTAREKV